MKVVSLDEDPIAAIPYLNAGKRVSDFTREILPVYKGTVDCLPKGVDAVILTSDLQGLEDSLDQSDLSPRLLGEVVPELLLDVLADHRIASGEKVMALLAGDFYTYPDLRGRGGTGDVTSVWNAFAESFRWVVGVAGNHDLFGTEENVSPKWFGPDVFFLDGEVIEVGGVRIGGVGGIIGNSKRKFPQNVSDYMELLKIVLDEDVDLLLLHEGPSAYEKGCRGIDEIRELIEQKTSPLVIRGHKHWPTPLAALKGGTQILNTEATIVVLVEEAQICEIGDDD